MHMQYFKINLFSLDTKFIFIKDLKCNVSAVKQNL